MVRVLYLHVTGSSKIGKPQKMKFEWGKRNAPFYSLLMMSKALNCDKIYLTHAKADYGATGEVIGSKPNWHNWGDYLFQVISTRRTRKQNDVVYKAELLSSKSNTKLVGKSWETLVVGSGKVEWNGIKELREGTLMMEDYPVRSIYKLLLEQNRTPYLATIVNYLMELKSLSKESAKVFYLLNSAIIN